jgi:hypothetical protein
MAAEKDGRNPAAAASQVVAKAKVRVEDVVVILVADRSLHETALHLWMAAIGAAAGVRGLAPSFPRRHKPVACLAARGRAPRAARRTPPTSSIGRGIDP